MDRLGRYEILYELGHGAMGKVYRARDPQIDRVVAVKTINVAAIDPAEAEEYRRRFFREAQAAGRLSHSGIVTIYDAGEDAATHTPYLVMEFVAGMTLEQLGQGDRLPLEKVLELVKQIAEALDYAHTQQIVHRDIKPANLIVAQDGRAKITDFGIAKLQSAQYTQTGMVLGTPHYMSPEQATGAAVDGRSDVFSLGTTLYWLVTGKKPFAGDTLAQLSYKIAHTDPAPPTEIDPALPADLDYVLQRALAKDPEERYPRAQDFAADLEDLQNGRPPRSRAKTLPLPSPPPEATVVQALLPPRKRRWLLPVGIAAALLLLLGAGWWWSRASKPNGQPSEVQAGAAGTPSAETKRPGRQGTQTTEGRPQGQPGSGEARERGLEAEREYRKEMAKLDEEERAEHERHQKELDKIERKQAKIGVPGRGKAVGKVRKETAKLDQELQKENQRYQDELDKIARKRRQLEEKYRGSPRE